MALKLILNNHHGNVQFEPRAFAARMPASSPYLLSPSPLPPSTFSLFPYSPTTLPFLPSTQCDRRQCSTVCLFVYLSVC